MLERMRWLFTTSAVFACLIAAPAAQARVIELGVQNPRPPASCPDDCQAIGQVTGFQVKQGTVRHPFQVNRRGKIVAFTISLGKPNAEQIDFFTEALRRTAPRAAHHPAAGHQEALPAHGPQRGLRALALLRLEPHVRALPAAHGEEGLRGGPHRAHLGAGVRRRALEQRAVALLARRRALRRRQPDTRRSSGSGSLRTYGCLYKTARLLYTATFIPDPRPTTK